MLTKQWYQNGQLQRETKQDATFIPRPTLNKSQQEIGYLMTWDYSENGTLIRETKACYPNGFRGSVHGYEKVFYETGEIKMEVDYSEGIDKKVTKTYQLDGTASIK